MKLNYFHTSLIGLAMTLATHSYVNGEVQFSRSTTQNEVTKYNVTGSTPSKSQLAELFNVADQATCPDNPSDEGCYSHTNAKNITIKKNATYITVKPLNGENIDTIHYKIPGLRTESGLTFKKTKPNTFKVEYTPLTARDISDLFDAWDLTKGNHCENTGVNNYHQDNASQYIEANCTAKKQSTKDYTQINYKHPAVQKLLAKVTLPGAYKTKKVHGKVKVITDKRTPVRTFLHNLEDMCGRLDMNCHGLLNVMYFETGGTYDPQKKNPVGSATGLIQFIKETAQDLGTSTKALRLMSANEQLKYVEAYFNEQRDNIKDANRKCNYQNPLDIALAVFYPGAVGRTKNYVIGEKQHFKTIKSKKGKPVLIPQITRYRAKAYKQNAGLDKNKDGKITASEYALPSLTRGGF